LVAGGRFARDTEMAQAIRSICRDIQIEDEVVAMGFERVHSEAQACKPSAELWRRLVDIDEFLDPVEANLHKT
jgi:hypothetical protein